MQYRNPTDAAHADIDALQLSAAKSLTPIRQLLSGDVRDADIGAWQRAQCEGQSWCMLYFLRSFTSTANNTISL